MRRHWIPTLALTAVLAVACARAAAYTPTIIKEGFPPMFFNGGFEPTKLPKKKPGPAHLTLVGSDLLVAPTPLKEAIFEIDRNVAFDVRGLAVCRGRPIDLPAGPGDPCKKARVGRGKMEFEIAFPETTPVAVKSHAVAYNGGRRDGVTTILVRGYLPNPISATVVVKIEVTKIDQGRYGTKLVAAIPPVAGGAGSMKEFRLEFFRRFAHRHRKQSFVKARCFDGKLQAHWEAIFADGTDVPGKFARPCTPVV